jgi:transposase-like protein
LQNSSQRGRTGYKNYSKENMKNAIKAVNEGIMSVKKAVEKFKVNKQTLYRKTQNENPLVQQEVLD